MAAKIVAIGGGDVRKKHMLRIDREIIRLSGKAHPKLLFIPTASVDSESYWKIINKYFSRLGCRAEVLWLIREKPLHSHIKKKILGADIIYVGGGNTMRMLKMWKRRGVDRLLKAALKKGTVLSGISAGAICWFKLGNSDSLKYSNKKSPLIKLKGLGFIPLMACPHYDGEKDRRPSLRRMIAKDGGMAVAICDCAAFEIVGRKWRIVAPSANAKAYLVRRLNEKVAEEELPKDMKFREISKLAGIGHKSLKLL